MSARDDAIAELIEGLRTRLFRVDGIVSTAALAARSGADGDGIGTNDAEMLYQALRGASEIIDTVAGEMQAEPFLREVDRIAAAAAAEKIETARQEARIVPAASDEEGAQPTVRPH